MDNVVKIASKQSVFDTSGSKSLVDFELPQGSGVYDLSKSYFNVRVLATATHATNVNAQYNLVGQLLLDTGSNDHVYPTAALVKNASWFSGTSGKVEDLRKVDSLVTNQSLYLKNQEEKMNDLGGLASYNRSSYFGAQPLSELHRLGSTASRMVAKDTRIPVKDVFGGIGNSDGYDTGRLGNSKIHLEMNFNKLSVVERESTATWNAYETIRSMDVSTVTNECTTADIYADPNDILFYVGMPVTLTGKVGTTAGGDAGSAAFAANSSLIITNIIRTQTGEITLTFDGNITGTALPAGSSIYGLQVAYLDANAVAPISIEGVELVAHISSEMAGAPAITYSTMLSEEDNYPVQNSINRYYYIEPACKGVMVAFTANGAVSRDLLKSYRITIDGHEISPRDIDVGGSLHKDLIQKHFLNRGLVVHSINELLPDYDTNRTNATITTRSQIVAFPVPFVNRRQQVGIELNADDGSNLGGQHILYKEVLKSI